MSMYLADQVKGAATGMIFMAVFSVLWAYTGTLGLQGWGEPWVFLLSMMISILLMVGGIYLMKSSKKLTRKTEDKTSRGDQLTTQRVFNLVFALEGVAIFIVAFMLNQFNLAEHIPASIAIIVGVHFIPLAFLFRLKLYHWAGGALCLLGLISLTVAPNEIVVFDHSIWLAWIIASFGSAVVLWGIGGTIWVTTKKAI
ncbi:hypothetical protein [Aureibacillus halotolerans]|uniref:Uncharacterized protein n=1 Tax=Aureibacillus halotolerans TaxID=1508390 RepID=A0A4R6U9Y6_9BACI|nr:hypothetical protein [Aureibacillus halotolerans]TDQ42636.1 hypothetical protein EV213_10165 [Aureibacillus halotolerans]